MILRLKDLEITTRKGDSLKLSHGARGMAQSEMHLHENLNLIPRNKVKMPKVVAHTCHPRVRKAEARESLELACHPD